MTLSAPDRQSVRPARFRTDNLGTAFVAVFVAVLFLIPATVVLPGPLKSNGSPAVLLAIGAFGLLVLQQLTSGPSSRLASAGAATVLMAAGLHLITWAGGQTHVLSPDVRASTTRGLITLIGYTSIALVVMLTVRTQWQRHAVVITAVAAMSYSGVIGILQGQTSFDGRYLLLPPGFVLNRNFVPQIRGGFVRVIGTSDSPIEFAVYMSSLLALSLLLMRNASSVATKVLAASGAVIALLAAPESVSRTGVLCLAAVALVYTFSVKLRVMGYALIGVALLVALLFVLEPARYHELLNLFVHAKSDDSITGRTSDYASVGKSFDAHPLLGTGLGTTPPTATRFLDNQWLQAIVQGGVVGVTAVALQFTAAIGGCWPFNDRRRRNEGIAYLAVFVAILVSSFTFDLYAFNQIKFLLFVVIGLAWSAKADAARLAPRNPLANGVPVDAAVGPVAFSGNAIAASSNRVERGEAPGSNDSGAPRPKASRRSPFRRLRLEDLLNAEGQISTDLQRTVRNGMASSAATRILVQVTQLAGTIVLARLLSPSEYGTVAVALVLAGLANIFTDLGIGGAIVHNRKLTQADLATAFWVNAATGLALTMLFSILAWPVSHIYGKPQLVGLIVVTSLGFTLAASTVHIAIFERQFRFALIGIIDTIAAFTGLVVAITLAVLGLGPMSLAVNFVVVAAIRSVCCWSVLGGIPTGRPTRDALQGLFLFGRGLVGYNVLTYFSVNIDNIVISRVSGLAELGLYSRAYNLMLLPIYQIQQIMGRVLFPAMSTLQDDLPRMRNALERSLPLLVTVGAPMSLGLAASSEALIRVLYGSQWSAAAPLLEALAIAGPPLILNGALNAGILALGMTDIQFRRGAVNALSTVAAVAIGIHWGSQGVAIGLTIRAYLFLPVSYTPCAKRLGLRTALIARATVGSLLAAIFMAAVVLELRSTGNGWPTLTLQVASGAVLYPLLLRLLNPQQFRTLTGALKRRT